MSMINLLLNINAYKDKVPTNTPKMSHFNWTLQQQSMNIIEPESKNITIQPNCSYNIFSGMVELEDDNTTTYDLVLKSGTTNTYIIKHNGGKSPSFRTPRQVGADATTEVQVVKNGSVLKFESTNGTMFDLVSGNVKAGDVVKIGDIFDPFNQGKFKILSFTATSFEIENLNGVDETVVLDVNFLDEIQIFSKEGVQEGDILILKSGFNSFSFGEYEITDVSPDHVEFYSSLKMLPIENGVFTQLLINRGSKSFIYIESDQKLSISIDGANGGILEPMGCGTKFKKGVFLKTGRTFEISITNESTIPSSVFFALGE